MLRRRFLALFTGFFAAVVSLGRVFNKAWARQANGPMPQTPLNDVGTMDFLFTDIRVIPRMPAPMEAFVKDRFDRAETEYRQGRKPGVREQSIADAYNLLASEFDVPDYAFTSRRQVRLVRMSVARSFPKFMEIDQINESVVPEMSPLQAAYVLKGLVELKLVSPDYQIPPAEWDQTAYVPQMTDLQRIQERIQEAQRRRELTKQEAPGDGRAGRAFISQGEYTVTVGKLVGGEPRPTKYQELYQILSRRVALLTPTEGLELLNRTLTTLGI